MFNSFSLIDGIFVYSALAFSIFTLIAIFSGHIETSVSYVISVFWPFSLLIVFISLFVTLIGWDFDVYRRNRVTSKMKPKHYKGFTISCFAYEFLFWKKRF